MKNESLSVRISETAKKFIKDQAAKENRSITNFLDTIILDYMKRNMNK